MLITIMLCRIVNIFKYISQENYMHSQNIKPLFTFEKSTNDRPGKTSKRAEENPEHFKDHRTLMVLRNYAKGTRSLHEEIEIDIIFRKRNLWESRQVFKQVHQLFCE